MLWFNFILGGLNFLFLCFKKLKPRIKLNLNIYLTGSAKSYLLVLHSYGSDKPENHAKEENRKGKEKERIEEKEKKK